MSHYFMCFVSLLVFIVYFCCHHFSRSTVHYLLALILSLPYTSPSNSYPFKLQSSSLL